MNCFQFIYFLMLISTALAAFNKVIRAPQCLFMADAGLCDAKIRVFGYDYVSNRCVHFYYTGCGGNPNRFATRRECMDTCYVQNADGHDPIEEATFDLFYKDEL
ncbi:kunitz-type serine protease inhibitor-like [Drosophila navojoa]|nr:kunitz-type serine protease inhibitor-like [Drosophila navojoa]